MTRCLLAVALVLVLGCGSPTVEESGVTGLHVAFLVPQENMSEVAGVLFEVRDEVGQAREALFSLEDDPAVCLLGPDFSGQACTDWLVRLAPGEYTVTATPLDAHGSPSTRFAVAQGGASVLPGITSEIVLARTVIEEPP